MCELLEMQTLIMSRESSASSLASRSGCKARLAAHQAPKKHITPSTPQHMTTRKPKRSLSTRVPGTACMTIAETRGDRAYLYHSSFVISHLSVSVRAYLQRKSLVVGRSSFVIRIEATGHT